MYVYSNGAVRQIVMNKKKTICTCYMYISTYAVVYIIIARAREVYIRALSVQYLRMKNR